MQFGVLSGGILQKMAHSNPQALAGAGFQDRCNSHSASSPRCISDHWIHRRYVLKGNLRNKPHRFNRLWRERRYAPEDIVMLLGEAEVLHSRGLTTIKAFRQIGVAEQTYCHSARSQVIGTGAIALLAAPSPRTIPPRGPRASVVISPMVNSRHLEDLAPPRCSNSTRLSGNSSGTLCVLLLLELLAQGGERWMSWWNGVADCPQCGCHGTLLVSGRTSRIEIEGCWVCGFARNLEPEQEELFPLHRLNLQRRSLEPRLSLN